LDFSNGSFLRWHWIILAILTGTVASIGDLVDNPIIPRKSDCILSCTLMAMMLLQITFNNAFKTGLDLKAG